MVQRNRFSWWKAGAVIGVVAALIAVTFAVIPYYAVTWRVVTDERESKTTRNQTTYSENVTFDPDTGLPTSVAHSGMNYMIDDEFDREFVVDAFSEYETGTYADYPDAPRGGNPLYQFAILCYRGNKTDANKTVLSDADFDVTLTMKAVHGKVEMMIAFAAVFAIVFGVIAAPFTGGLSGVLIAAGAGALIGGGIGFAVSGGDVQLSGTLQTDNDGWASMAFGANLLPDDAEYTAEVELSPTMETNYLGFKEDKLLVSGEAISVEFGPGDPRAVFVAYLIDGNSDTFIQTHQQTYRSEVVGPRTRSDSSWQANSFKHDATIWAYDTSADEDYNSEASTHMGAWYGEVASHRKLKISDPLPANFQYVVNVTYSGSICSIGSGSITHLNGSDYAVSWKWTTNSLLPTGAITINAQIRYTTNGWATETAVWIGNETAVMPLDIYKVRWRFTWNDPTGEDINRITYDRELMPNAIYDLQAPFYTDGATNSITSNEFISESNESGGEIPDFTWWETIYGTNPFETQGSMNLMLADNSTTYCTLSGTYEYSGNDLLKVGWEIPVDNISKEASYSLTLWKGPYDFKVISPATPQIFGESLYFELTDWLNHRSEVVTLQTLLDTYFPTDANEFQPGNEVTLKNIVGQMAGKVTKLEIGTNYLVNKYGATSDSDTVLESIGMFDQMFAQISKILGEKNGLALQKDIAAYQSLRLAAYEALDAYQMAFGKFSAFVMDLKGESQIHDEYNVLVEVWESTVRERYQYLMKDKNLAALSAIALALALIVTLSIVAAVHYVYVRKTRTWNKGRKEKAFVVLAYLGFAIILAYVLYAFVFLGVIEYWYGVALG